MQRLVGLYYNRRLEIFLVLSILSLIGFFCLERSFAMAFIASCIVFESLLLFFANLWILPKEERKVHLSVFVILLTIVFCCFSLTNSMFGHQFSGGLAFLSFSVIVLCLCLVKILRKCIK